MLQYEQIILQKKCFLGPKSDIFAFLLTSFGMKLALGFKLMESTSAKDINTHAAWIIRTRRKREPFGNSFVVYPKSFGISEEFCWNCAYKVVIWPPKKRFFPPCF